MFMFHQYFCLERITAKKKKLIFATVRCAFTIDNNCTELFFRIYAAYDIKPMLLSAQTKLPFTHDNLRTLTINCLSLVKIFFFCPRDRCDLDVCAIAIDIEVDGKGHSSVVEYGRDRRQSRALALICIFGATSVGSWSVKRKDKVSAKGPLVIFLLS